MSYILLGNRVVREDGYVGLQHRNSNGAMEKVGDTAYTWIPKYNVSLCWVAPEHVDFLLRAMAKICCGKRSKKFFLASLINTNLWYGFDRDGNYKR
jgi:hypothetical protein